MKAGQIISLVDELKQNAADNQAIKSENEWLKGYLELYQNNPSLILSDARIISYESGNYSSVLTLNKGAVHGIKKNMPVLAFQNGNKGLVGKIIQVGTFTSQVIPIYNIDNIV